MQIVKNKFLNFGIILLLMAVAGGKGVHSSFKYIYPDCGSAGTDIWTMTKNSRTLTHATDIVNACKG